MNLTSAYAFNIWLAFHYFFQTFYLMKYVCLLQIAQYFLNSMVQEEFYISIARRKWQRVTKKVIKKHTEET